MDSPDMNKLLDAGRSKRATLSKVQGPQRHRSTDTSVNHHAA